MTPIRKTTKSLNVGNRNTSATNRAFDKLDKWIKSPQQTLGDQDFTV